VRSWSARYLDGVSAQTQQVTLMPTAHGLELRRADGALVVWAYADITQTQGSYRGEQVRLERGRAPVQALVVDDVDILTAMHDVAPRAAQRFHDPRLRSRRPMFVIFALVAAVALGAGIYFIAIPAAATFAAERVPVSWEEQLGEVVVGSLTESKQVCTNAAVARAVDDIVARLAATVPDNPYTFRVSVVRQNALNAFAAPGGHIVVFSGLLRRTDSPEQLAGVLAHEMSHVLRRHGTKSLFHDVSTSIFFSAIAGDASGAMRMVLDSAKTLGRLRYSRQAETEADVAGVRMLAAAHIDPRGMLSFFEKLQKREANTGGAALAYLSNHPLTSERIATLKATDAVARGPFKPLPMRGRWKTLATACNASKR
jgi:Zn-dependent protease with chaperone function